MNIRFYYYYENGIPISTFHHTNLMNGSSEILQKVKCSQLDIDSIELRHRAQSQAVRRFTGQKSSQTGSQTGELSDSCELVGESETDCMKSPG